VRITFSERAELEMYLHAQSDLWAKSDDTPGLWMRYAGDYAFLLQETDVSVILVGEGTQEAGEDLLKRLLVSWTGYSLRVSHVGILQNVLGLSDEIAHLVALELADAQPPPLAAAPPTRQPEHSGHVGTWMLLGGGYVNLRLQDDLLYAQLSIPMANEDLAFGGALRGIVRSYEGSTVSAAACLAGWPSPPLRPEEGGELARRIDETPAGPEPEQS
jgi:hypothetical protein